MIRPFFSFYGSKWRDAPRHYPVPEHSSIIEPFAGSAGYALRYADLQVTLCDADPVIVGVWSYLINSGASDILALPDVHADEDVNDLRVCQEARWLIGFWLNRAAAAPRSKPSAWMRSGIRPNCFWGPAARERIAAQLEHIRHWRVWECSYSELKGITRRNTWFIDPPYQEAGRHYVHGSRDIDYDNLSDFCKSRRGQTIVCENYGASWLPFKRLRDVKTTRSNRSVEAVWINNI